MPYMLDTNCFGEIHRKKLKVNVPVDFQLHCTEVQRAELEMAPDMVLREELLELFSNVHQDIIPASSFCFDIEGLGFDQAEWNDGTGMLERIFTRLAVLDKKSGKKKKTSEATFKNQMRDAAIAETALKNDLTLVTGDRNLRQVALENGIFVIWFTEFVTLTEGA